MSDDLQLFSGYFNLKSVSDDSFSSEGPHLAGPVLTRVIGGLLLSQATNAFTTHNSDLAPHTMHYKFIGPAKPDVPLTYKVNRFDGASVASILISQNDQVVGIAHFRFSNEKDFHDNSSIACPEDGPILQDYHFEGLGKLSIPFNALHDRDDYIVETRFIESKNNRRTTQWLRLKEKYHGSLNPTDGFNVAMFLCEFTMAFAGLEMYNKAGIEITTYASLDHSAWIHSTNVNPCGWFLSVTDCEVLSCGRALHRAWLFDEHRQCIMSVLQEGYMQRARGSKL